MTIATERGGAMAFAALILANVALAFGPLLVRLADTGPVAAGFWRLSLALPLLYLFAWRGKQPLVGYGKAIWAMLILGGIAFALDLSSWHIGIERTKLANATLFGNFGSIIMVAYGFIIGRAWPERAEIGAVLLAVVGAALLMGSSYDLAVENLVGDLFCLAAGVLYAVYLIVMRGARATLGSWAVLAHATLFGLAPALAVAVALGEPVWPQNWTPVLVLALTSQIIGQGLMIYALKHFTPVVVGLALLSQPAVAAATGWFAFGETLSLADAFGMIAIGIALVLIRLPEARKARARRGAPVAADPGRA